MSLSTLQLASTSALALLASSADAAHDQPIVLDVPHRLALDLNWKTKRTASDVLTDLLDVEGIRVVADRRLWSRPDMLALRHDFAADSAFHLYSAVGIDRAVYIDSRVVRPSSPPSVYHRQSVGMMAEVGASWRLTQQLDVESDIQWMDLTRNADLVRSDAKWGSVGPVALTVSLVWRGK